jgi:hypothetical protein
MSTCQAFLAFFRSLSTSPAAIVMQRGQIKSGISTLEVASIP